MKYRKKLVEGGGEVNALCTKRKIAKSPLAGTVSIFFQYFLYHAAMSVLYMPQLNPIF